MRLAISWMQMIRAVEADLNAVKSFLDAHQNAEEMTDSRCAELKAAQEKLTQSAQKVFAKMYEQTQAHRVQQAQVLIWEMHGRCRQQEAQALQMMML